MKVLPLSASRLRQALLVACAAGLCSLAAAQGLPPAAHDNIRLLFDQHAKVTRTVTLTPGGYEALTESDDPVVARTLRAHVAQMRERLESGLAVRRWDPAYAELVAHYGDLDLRVEPTAKGLRIVMTGKTPAAVKVAQNHAQIVSKFVSRGWTEHDVSHPAVAADQPSSAATCSTCGREGAGNAAAGSGRGSCERCGGKPDGSR